MKPTVPVKQQASAPTQVRTSLFGTKEQRGAPQAQDTTVNVSFDDFRKIQEDEKEHKKRYNKQQTRLTEEKKRRKQTESADSALN